MSDHTPGPWHLRVNPVHEGQFDIRCETYGYAPLAVVRGDKRSTMKKSFENARLIAAAPDLLEALQTLLGDALQLRYDELPPESVAKAKAVIAKATGQA